MDTSPRIQNSLVSYPPLSPSHLWHPTTSLSNDPKDNRQPDFILPSMTSLTSTASATSTNERWMWRYNTTAIAPPYESSSSTNQPALTSTNDPVELAERRCYYHLERSQKITPTSTDIAVCERAMSIFRNIKHASASEKEGSELVHVLEELNLHTLKENGPLSLPSPSSCSERTLHYAQMNWETIDESVPWSDQATLEWVLYGLRSQARASTMAALCLVGRLDQVNAHEAPNDETRSLEEVYGRLHVLVINALSWMKATPEQIEVITQSNDIVELKHNCQTMVDLLEDAHEEDDAPGLNHENDNGPWVFSVASCDECAAALFLPEFQRCPMNHTLSVCELKEKNRYCDLCEQTIQVGSVIRRCTKCGIDFCQTCSGPWWHEVGQESDLCVHHYNEKKKGYVRIQQREDLGEQLVDYFEEEGEGEWLEEGKEEGKTK